MADLATSVSMVAPLYNFLFVIISIFLFIKLFRKPSTRSFMLPWKLLFTVIIIFVLETVLTILRQNNVLPQFVYYFNGVFEFSMGVLIVFLLLSQKEYIDKHYLF